MAQHEIEHRREVLARPVEHFVRPALPAGGVQHREVELIVVRAECGEQVEHLGMDLVGPRVLAIDLVDHHDRAQAARERLADHELGLRQHAFGGVDQDDRAIDHVQDALDLAAEIGVARRVDDVDARVFPDHAGALGEDGDAALTLEVVAVQRALGDLLVLAERAGLTEQLIDQRRLAVIDVRDDRDIADVHDACWGKLTGAPRAARMLRRTHRDLDAPTRAQNAKRPPRLGRGGRMGRLTAPVNRALHR